MKKACRLRNSKDFKRVLDQRQRAGKSKSMTIFYAANTLGHARIGLSVSAKVGNAVLRARIRRQLRAQMNLVGILPKSFDIVVIVRPPYIESSFQDNLAVLKNSLGHLPTENTEEQK